MEDVHAQLRAVEEALRREPADNDRLELEALRDNLLELIELTGETAPTAAPDDLDREMSLFMNEIESLECAENPGDDGAAMMALRQKYANMVGEKCAAPHEHAWGAISYHNALICGVEEEQDDEEVFAAPSRSSSELKLRVLYTNPTHREMVPCKYYLDGDCRFDTARCNFSHGELVPADSIRAYKEPEFARLARNCVVLTRLDDRIWHRGRVLCVNFVEQNCRIRLDGREHKQRELDRDFQDIFPILSDNEQDESATEAENSQSSHALSNDDDDEEEEEDLDDHVAAQRAQLIEQSLFTFKPTQRLGEWEKHTRGIGSKLMAKMGYIHGTGLGSDGRGIVTPVAAQILPKGRSLDACMELRECANGADDFFSVEKKLLRNKKRQDAINKKAYERATAERTDVFAFLNDNILANVSVGAAAGAGAGSSKKQQTNACASKTSDFGKKSIKSLNVDSVRLADDIRQKEREIVKIKGSLGRNAQSAGMQSQLTSRLGDAQEELRGLQQQASAVTREQDARKAKSKMYAF